MVFIKMIYFTGEGDSIIASDPVTKSCVSGYGAKLNGVSSIRKSRRVERNRGRMRGSYKLCYRYGTRKIFR